MREKLIELIRGGVNYHTEATERWILDGKKTEEPRITGSIADHLLANGVIVKNGAVWKPFRDNLSGRQLGWICSNCSVVIDDIANGDTPYCPYCGEPMETEDA